MSAPTMSIEGLARSVSGRSTRIALAILAAGLAVVGVGYVLEPQRSVYLHDLTFLYLASLGIGALFLIALEYITDAVWSVPMRRVTEYLGSLVILAPLVALPLLVDAGRLFPWLRPEVVAASEAVAHKAAYLNYNFLVIRFAAIFGVFALFYLLFRRHSVSQDTTKDARYTTRNIRLSAPFFILLAVGTTFFCVDWAMSLEPEFYSTMFGVYFFAGSVVATLAASTLIVLWLMDAHVLPAFTRDHLYSLGALMFAFLNFWAYIAFCQFMLIWYANLPEETFWFIQRWQGGWMFVSILLIVMQFGVPYFALLPQDAKMDRRRLRFVAAWLLVAHLVDLYWVVMPSHSEHLSFSWIDLGYVAAGFGFVMTLVTWFVRRGPAVPVGDPKLQRGLEFRL